MTVRKKYDIIHYRQRGDGYLKNKKTIKRIGITLGVLFLFGTGVALGSALDTWDGIGGKQHADNTEKILNDLDTLLGEKSKAKDDALREVERMLNQIKDKENLIIAKNNEIETLKKRIETLQAEGNGYKNKYEELLKELEKAKKDVSELESKGREIYEKHK